MANIKGMELQALADRAAKLDGAFREIVQLTAENERLRAALKPFADYADPTNMVPSDLQISNGSHFTRKQLRMGDCYKARRALFIS